MAVAAWQVHYIYVARLEKDKYVVPVYFHAPSTWYCFLINSNLTPLQESNPRLRECAYMLPQHQHQFLQWDSYLVCQDAFTFSEADINNPVGVINGSCKDAVCGAIEKCPTLPRKTKSAILNSLLCSREDSL